jgi:hypothetical protein
MANDPRHTVLPRGTARSKQPDWPVEEQTIDAGLRQLAPIEPAFESAAPDGP